MRLPSGQNPADNGERAVALKGSNAESTLTTAGKQATDPHPSPHACFDDTNANGDAALEIGYGSCPWRAGLHS